MPNVHMRGEIEAPVAFVNEALTNWQMSLSSSTVPSVMRKMSGIELVVSAKSFIAWKYCSSNIKYVL